MEDKNGGVASPVEEKEAGQFPSDGLNEGANALVKFDIGDFVHHHKKIQILLRPWVRLLDSILDVIRWRSPYVSLFCLVMSCISVLFCPVLYIILPSVYALVVMLFFGIKKKGSSKQGKKTMQRTIKKKADNNDLNVKAAVEKQVQEDIKEFITLLVQLDALTELIKKGLEDVNRVLKWEDFKTSLSLFLAILLAIVMPMFVPFPVIMVVLIISMFCFNSGFKPVATQVLVTIKNAAKSLLSLVGLGGLYASFYTKPNRQLSTKSLDEDEWYDAEIEERAEHSSDYGSDNEDYSESLVNRKKDDSSSILAQLADYRRKQKKLNSGKCRMCDVPFSSILKKRQYCRHCGDSFCSKCCSHRVKRSVFGATAPAAYEETVLVCKPCYDHLMNENTTEQAGPSW